LTDGAYQPTALARGAARRAQARLPEHPRPGCGRGGAGDDGRDRFVNAQIDNQKARNDYITQNIRELDKQVEEIRDLQRKRNQLIDRMRVIQELQGNRPIIVRVLDQLVRTVPDGVFYTSVTSKQNSITINGVAESNNRVSSLMRRLDASDWLKNPNLDAVRAAPPTVTRPIPLTCPFRCRCRQGQGTGGGLGHGD
jgi:hypothetical protein